MVLRFYHYPIPALPPNAPMTPAALAPTPAPPETCVRADRKACRKGAVGGPVLGPLARTRAIFTDRHLLRGIPRVCIGIMRVRRATHGGGIMKPVVIYRAPDEKRAIFFERFAATRPFMGLMSRARRRGSTSMRTRNKGPVDRAGRRPTFWTAWRPRPSPTRACSSRLNRRARRPLCAAL